MHAAKCGGWGRGFFPWTYALVHNIDRLALSILSFPPHKDEGLGRMVSLPRTSAIFLSQFCYLAINDAPYCNNSGILPRRKVPQAPIYNRTRHGSVCTTRFTVVLCITRLRGEFIFSLIILSQALESEFS